MIASTVTVEEKSGAKRRIVLRGAGLPLRGASWKGEQRLVTKWYVGNPYEATQHVLGPIDPPSEWHGVWNTTRLIGTPPSFYSGAGAAEQRITRASSMRDIFDQLARDAALLRVTWATDDGRQLVREGRIGPYSFDHERMDDIQWSITFVWVGRGDGPPRSLELTGENMEASFRAVYAALNDFAGTITGNLGPFSSIVGLPNSSIFSTFDEFHALSHDVTAFLQDTSDLALGLAERIDASFSSSVDETTATPHDVSIDVSLSAAAAAAATATFGQELGRRPVETMVAPGSRPSRVAAMAAYAAAVHGASDQAHARAQNLAAAARKRRSAAAPSTARIDRAAPEHVIATVRARAGETFASLALKYYGTPDAAGAIARANGVPSYQVAPCAGALTLIPVLTSTDLTAP